MGLNGSWCSCTELSAAMGNKCSCKKPRLTKTVGIIPARMKSERFPGKVLANINGKPMLWWVYKQAKKAKKLEEVYIASNDAEVRNFCKLENIPFIQTIYEHENGTSRVAEAAEVLELKDTDKVVNIQGDEPLIDPDTIDKVASALDNFVGKAIVVGKMQIVNGKENRNIVKIVTDNQNRALYFSRGNIPCGEHTARILQQGIYGYWVLELREYTYFKPGVLEKCEKLEQLRFLENGTCIQVVYTNKSSVGVDTEEDLIRVNNLMRINSGK